MVFVAVRHECFHRLLLELRGAPAVLAFLYSQNHLLVFVARNYCEGAKLRTVVPQSYRVHQLL